MAEPAIIIGIGVSAYLAAKHRKKNGANAGASADQFNSSYEEPRESAPAGPRPDRFGMLRGIAAKARESALAARERSSSGTKPFKEAKAKPARSWRNTGQEEFEAEAAASSGSAWQRLKAAPKSFAEAMRNIPRPGGVTHGRPAATVTDKAEGEAMSDNTGQKSANRNDSTWAINLCWASARDNFTKWEDAIQAAAATEDPDRRAALLAARRQVALEIDSLKGRMEADCRKAARAAADGSGPKNWLEAMRASVKHDSLLQILMRQALEKVKGEVGPTSTGGEAAAKCSRCQDKTMVPIRADGVPQSAMEATPGDTSQRWVACPGCRPNAYAANVKEREAQQRQSSAGAKPKDAEAAQKEREQAARQAAGNGAGNGTGQGGVPAGSGTDPATLFVLAQSLSSGAIGSMPLDQIFRLMEVLVEVGRGLEQTVRRVANRLDGEARFDPRIVEHFTSAASQFGSGSNRISDGRALATQFYRQYTELVRQARVPSREVLNATRNG